MTALLEVRDLSVYFGGLRAVDQVGFSIAEHEVVALIGPNGAGKTTTFNAISGAQTPTAGAIRFKGRDTTGWSPAQMARTGMARTFQNVRLFSELSLRENLMMGAYVATECGIVASALRLPRHRRAEAQARMAADAWLDRLGLTRYADTRAISLPFGLQRVAEIGRAMVSKPSLVLLDEPAAGLNPAEKDKLAGLLKEIAAETGASLLLIDHDMTLVMGVAQRIIVLDFGRKLAEGFPADIAANPAVIEAYMGV